MAIPNFLGFVLENITATTGRKVEIKNALAKQWGWTAKIDDGEGNEIDNPLTFQQAFNKHFWAYGREEMVAGQQKLDKELREADDTFEDLV